MSQEQQPEYIDDRPFGAIAEMLDLSEAFCTSGQGVDGDMTLVSTKDLATMMAGVRSIQALMPNITTMPDPFKQFCPMCGAVVDQKTYDSGLAAGQTARDLIEAWQSLEDPTLVDHEQFDAVRGLFARLDGMMNAKMSFDQCMAICPTLTRAQASYWKEAMAEDNIPTPYLDAWIARWGAGSNPHEIAQAPALIDVTLCLSPKDGDMHTIHVMGIPGAISQGTDKQDATANVLDALKEILAHRAEEEIESAAFIDPERPDPAGYEIFTVPLGVTPGAGK